MRANKFLLTLALSCGLMALPSLAQNAAAGTPNQQTPQASPSTSSTDQQAPPASESGAISSDQNQNSMGATSAGSTSAIQTSVQDALQKDSQLAGQSVNAQVNSKNQIVLTGTVSSQDQKDHAEQVATQAAGSGYTVKNHIKVSGTAGSMGSTSSQPPQK